MSYVMYDICIVQFNQFSCPSAYNFGNFSRINCLKQHFFSCACSCWFPLAVVAYLNHGFQRFKPFYIAYGEKRAPKKNVRENCLGKRYQYITHMMSFLYHYQTSFNLRVSATLPCSLHLFRYQTG